MQKHTLNELSTKDTVMCLHHWFDDGKGVNASLFYKAVRR